MDILELTKEAGLDPKQKASTHGGEYCSPCPFCKDGNDRFLIWPNRCNSNADYQGGRFSCRVCGNYGDAITFMMQIQRISYSEACASLKIKPKKPIESAMLRKEVLTPVAEDPPQLWQAKASAFVNWSHEHLLNNPAALDSVIARGFTKATVEKFKLGFNPGETVFNKQRDFFRKRSEWGLQEEIKQDGKPRLLWLPIGIVIPTFSADERVIKIKNRRLDWQDGDKLPKYVEISGSKRCPSIYGIRSLQTALIVESELDGLLIQQEAADLCYCISLGGSTKPLDRETDALIRKTPLILFCPDFDEAGKKAWDSWKKKFPLIQRILTPEGKGAGDAFLAGINLREWISETIEEVNTRCNRKIYPTKIT